MSASSNLLKALLVRGAAAVGISGIENASELNTADGRPQLAAVIEHLRPGDALAVWRFDRLGRSLPHLLETVPTSKLSAPGLPPSPNGGRLIFTMLGARAEFERNLLRKRLFAGSEAAKKQGRTGVQPPVLDEKQKAIAETLRVATLYRNLSWTGGAQRF